MRKLKQARLPTQLLVDFNRSTIESILTYDIIMITAVKGEKKKLFFA